MANKYDVIIIGAGAAGLMCAIEAGRRRRNVLVIDHADRAGQKILSSGGGHCNFTNRNLEFHNYISGNPHFCKSAISRFTQWDFLALVEKHRIAYEERDFGRLFCKGSSRGIVKMLLTECELVGISFRLGATIEKFEKIPGNHFLICSSAGDFSCQSLVVATGGLSRPALGASPLGYKIAEQFQIKVRPTGAALVPFTLQPKDKENLSELSGIALDVVVGNDRRSFQENILFTHRGLSGPVILQISSYWNPGEEITINLLPETDLFVGLLDHQKIHPRRKVKSVLTELLPKRLIQAFISEELAESPLRLLTSEQLSEIAQKFQHWTIKPGGTEGYRSAEVTRGGVDCDAISSKTMEALKVPGLFFIGEVLDVTGWLGGYNLQWAWSAGWCAGQVV